MSIRDFKIPTRLFAIAVLLFLNLSFLAIPAKPQDFNPPYPRIGQIYFYWPVQGPEIWKNHDLVIIRYKHNDAAREIKRLNPNAVLLACNDRIVSHEGKWPVEWYLKCDRSMWGQGHCTNEGILYAGSLPLLNITNECPMVDNGYGPQRFNEFLPEHLVNKTDYNYFDGTFFDYWGKQIWGSKVDYTDINNDYVSDGGSYVNQKWREGNETLVNNLRALNSKPIAAHESDNDYLNGNGFEFWPDLDKKRRMVNAFDIQQKSKQPAIIFAEGYGYEKGPDFGPKWRVDFTSSQIVGAFFGHDEGTAAHRFTFIHDEYEADLGHPLSGSAGAPQQIIPDLWVRYFEKGAIISNVTGSSYTLNNSQLDGRQYWRFKGGQDPAFNNGQKFTSVSFDGYDGIMLFTEPTTLMTPIVIDNVSKNMTSPGQNPVNYSGTWEQIRWVWNVQIGKSSYGLGVTWGSEGYLYAISHQQGEASYRPKFNVAGKYEIYEWHADVREAGQTPCDNVKLVITSAEGTGEKTVDQSVNSGQWNSLGVYNFDKGSAGNVVLKAPDGCTTCSDAIRFVYHDPNVQTADRTPPNPPRNIKVNSN